MNNLTTLREVAENDEAQVKAYDKAQDEVHDDIDKKIIEFCKKEKNIFEIMKYIGYKNRTRFRRDYIKPLVEKGLLKMTIPDKPTSRNQKYMSI